MTVTYEQLIKKYGSKRWCELETKLKPSKEEMDDLHLAAILMDKSYKEEMQVNKSKQQEFVPKLTKEEVQDAEFFEKVITILRDEGYVPQIWLELRKKIRKLGSGKR